MDAAEIEDLERGIREITEVAHGFGLDPFPVHFEVVPATIMHEMAAYGIPGRFSHWTHGRTYLQSKTMYDYGLTRVYEMVINSDPAYAFLLDTNPVLENKVVVAHVLGHVDFFKNNAYYQLTDRGSVNSVAAHADRIRQYEYEHGSLVVEQFLDAVLALERHVDPHSRFKRRMPEKKPKREIPHETEYDDLFFLGSQKRADLDKQKPKVPPEPDADILLFIAEYARNLEDWQRDIVHIVRQESLYFNPQGQTKIINEGFASYWHSRIMREVGLSSTDYIAFSRMHAGVIASDRRHFNPYALGLALLEDIERRWDKPSDDERKRDSTRRDGQGRAKIMEVRQVDNDVSLVRNYFTAEVCEKLDMYTYHRDEDGEMVIIDRDWEKVRDRLVVMLTNMGQPYIQVEDGNYRDNGDLLLRHQYEDQELDIEFAEKTLRSLHVLWGRPVHIATRLKGDPVVMTYDGVTKRRSGEP